MPVIITGEAGNNGVADFVAALRAGRGDAVDRRRAEAFEAQYAQRLEIGVQQMKLNDQKLDALDAESRGREVYGELEGIWAQAQASGDPANVAGFQVMFNTRPEAAALWGRLAADSPELANEFRDNVLMEAQANMEAEQLQSFLETAQASEGVYLPEGWTQQAAQDIESGGTTRVEAERERVRMRKRHSEKMTHDQNNQKTLERIDALIGDSDDPQVLQLRNELDLEAQVNMGKPLDKDLLVEILSLATGAGQDGPPPQMSGIPTGGDQITGPGGQQYDPFQGVMGQAEGKGAGQAPDSKPAPPPPPPPEGLSPEQTGVREKFLRGEQIEDDEFARATEGMSDAEALAFVEELEAARAGGPYATEGESFGLEGMGGQEMDAAAMMSTAVDKNGRVFGAARRKVK